MPPKLRAARRGDLPAIYALLQRAFPEAPHLFAPQTERDATFRFRHARVAEVDGRVAGYVRIFARTMLLRGVPVAAGGTTVNTLRQGLSREPAFPEEQVEPSQKVARILVALLRHWCTWRVSPPQDGHRASSAS